MLRSDHTKLARLVKCKLYMLEPHTEHIVRKLNRAMFSVVPDIAQKREYKANKRLKQR
jgi:hypothetical protein